ncbi:hypothetical protein [Nocardia sp. NPDC020380]|uniref:hypothetical protein n=1 Tax=Nocardia sp. NPDC020380 TaxID=3364309 RepID=UPI0037934A3A
MRRLAGTLAVAAAAGALLVGPVVGAASAEIPGGGMPVAQDWAGFNHPGWHEPGDPWNDDWHCDRQGNWHNDEHDQWGHRDGRCHQW